MLALAKFFVFWLLLLFLVAGVRSQEWIEREGATSFDLSVTSWHFTLPLDVEPFFDARSICDTSSSGLLDPRCSPNAPTLQICCVDCVGPTPANSSSSNSPGCVCPPTDDFICLDFNNSVVGGKASPTQTVKFALPIRNPTCRPILLVLNSLSGDADLSVNVGNSAFVNLPPSEQQGIDVQPYQTFTQAEAGDDVFYICRLVGSAALRPNLGTSTSSVHALNPTASWNWVFVTVSAKVLSKFSLRVGIINNPRKLLIPIKELSNRVPVSVQFKYSNGLTTECTNSNMCELHSSILLPDPPFAFHALLSDIVTETDFDLSPSNTSYSSFGLDISLPAWITGDTKSRTLLVSDADEVVSCNVTVMSLTNLNGSSIAANAVYSEKAAIDVSLCNSSSLDSLVTIVNSKILSLKDDVAQLGDQVGSVASLHGSLISSQVWVSCNLLFEQLFPLSRGIQSVTSVNSTLCVLPSRSAEWQADPCCNPRLQDTMCCSPRQIEINDTEAPSFLKASQSALRSTTCKTPACSARVGTELVVARLSRLKAETTCKEQIVPVVNDPNIFVDFYAECIRILGAYHRQEAACVTPSDCFTNCSGLGLCTSPSDSSVPLRKALTNCLQKLIPPPLLAVFSSGNPSDETLDSYFIDSCDQGNRAMPNASLDTPEKCEAAFSCSSDPSLSESECNDLAASFPQFCASCDGQLCSEVSRFPGCAVFPPVTSREQCLMLRGTEWRHNTCYLAGNYSRSTCLHLWCAGADYSGPDACDFTCLLVRTQWGLENYCGCNESSPQVPGLPLAYDLVQKYCTSFSWDERISPSGCIIPISGSECATIAGANNYLTPNRGSQWLGEPFLATEDDCVGSSLPLQVCSKNCSSCSDPTCGACSDLNLNGVCFAPFQPQLTSTGTVLSCPEADSIIRPDGCFLPAHSQSTCQELGYEWRLPSITQEICEGYQACFEPYRFKSSSGLPISYSRKSSAECSDCNLSQRPTARWNRAVVVDRSELQWRNRTWSSGSFVWRSVFNASKFSQDISSARSIYLYLAFQSALACLSGQDQAAFAQIACDCSGGRDCYSDSLVTNLITTRICGLFGTSLTVPGQIVVEISSSAQFRDGCLPFTVDIILAETFARTSSSVVSSAFVQSLELKRLSVVENDQGVVIGQLASNGYQVIFGDGTSPSKNTADVVTGEVSLCVNPRLGSRQSGWKKRGIARAELDTDGNVANSHFKLWRISNMSESATSFGICFSVDRSGIYAIANYLDDANSATFFDTLTGDQKAALIIVIIVYLVLWLVISVALGNFALWWSLQRVARKFSVDQVKASLNFTLLWLASAIRWIYFLVVIIGAAVNMPKPVEIFMVELPLFFFFSVLTIVILKWLEVARKSGGKQKNPPLFSFSNVAAIILNSVMYGLLIIFVILASIGVANQERSKCSTKTGQEHPALSVTYHVIVAIVCFGLGASFMAIGTKVTVQLLRLGGATSQKVRFLQFTSVACACSIAMILQAILLLITTAVVVPSIVAILILIFVEVLPILLLVWTWNKPIAIGKVVSSIISLGSSSQSDSTSSGGISTTGETTSAGDSSPGSASSRNDSDTSSTVSAGGLARLWSLGTDSLDGASFAEAE